MLTKSWARVLGWVVRTLLTLIGAMMFPYPYGFVFMVLTVVSFSMVLMSAFVAYREG